MKTGESVDLNKNKQLQLEYIPVGKEVNLIREFLNAIPRQFIPTEKLGYIFVIIFVAVIAVGIINALVPVLDFSFDLDGEEIKEFELNIDVGLPFMFFGTDESKEIKMNIKGFLLDVIIWLILSYIIDVTLNYLFSIKLRPSKEELKRKPKEIQFQQRTISDKAASKIIEKIKPNQTNSKTQQDQSNAKVQQSQNTKVQQDQTNPKTQQNK